MNYYDLLSLLSTFGGPRPTPKPTNQRKIRKIERQTGRKVRR